MLSNMSKTVTLLTNYNNKMRVFLTCEMRKGVKNILMKFNSIII